MAVTTTGPAVLHTQRKGKVRLANGKVPPSNVDLQVDFIYEPDNPGSCGGGDMGYSVRQDGTFEYPCQAGKRTLVIYGNDREEFGRATVSVVGGETVPVTIRLTKTGATNSPTNNGRRIGT